MTEKICPLAPKHKWEWVKDITTTNITINSRGTTTRYSQRGVFKCACEAIRLGKARSRL